MFCSPGLAYLHLPRTGGTFITNLLVNKGVGTRNIATEIGGHDGIRLVPERLRQNALVFGTIRDPWSWCASIDAHYRHKSSLDGFLLEYFGGKNVSFKEALMGMTNPSSVSRLNLNKAARPPGCRLPEERLGAKLASAGIGLYTFMVIRMCCLEDIELLPNLNMALDSPEMGDLPWSVNALIDTAQLREGLHRVLSAWRPGVAADLQQEIFSGASQNAKGNFKGVLQTGRPDPAFYDQEMIQSVLKADGFLFRRFHYDKPVGAPERQPVTLLSR